MLKPHFRLALTESRKKELENELKEYWEYLGIKPNLLMEFPIVRWVEEGNSPWFNPHDEYDEKTGRYLDFWNGELQYDRKFIVRYIENLRDFGRWEELEEIEEILQEIMQKHRQELKGEK